MEKYTIEELLSKPYWIMDILPMQVPKDGEGQYAAVERYYLDRKRIMGTKHKHINVVLKMNCYRDILIEGRRV